MQREIETKSQVIKRIYSRDEITKNQLFFASKLESDVKQIHALITLTRDYVSQCDLMFSKMTIMIGDLIARDNDLMNAIENIYNEKSKKS